MMNFFNRGKVPERQVIGRFELTLLGIAAACISTAQLVIGKRNEAIGPLVAPGEVEHHLAMAYAQGQSDNLATILGDPSFYGLTTIGPDAPEPSPQDLDDVSPGPEHDTSLPADDDVSPRVGDDA